MNSHIRTYLKELNKYLKPLSIYSRQDITKEIETVILHMEKEGIPFNEIVKRLGSPKELSLSYLNTSYIFDSHYNIRFSKKTNIFNIVIFYIIVALSGIITIPALGIIAVVLTISATILPIWAIFSALNIFFDLNIYMGKIFFINFKLLSIHPLIVVVASFLIAFTFGYLATLSWKFIGRYIDFVINIKRKLSL